MNDTAKRHYQREIARIKEAAREEAFKSQGTELTREQMNRFQDDGELVAELERRIRDIELNMSILAAPVPPMPTAD
jgi:hypothetical protein